MQRFTTNMALRDSFPSKKEQSEIDDEEEFLTKEMQKKIQLIKKAFR
jgi:hypothetical protein